MYDCNRYMFFFYLFHPQKKLYINQKIIFSTYLNNNFSGTYLKMYCEYTFGKVFELYAYNITF